MDSQQNTIKNMEIESESPSEIKIVIISDTHNSIKKITIPKGDILIHCGDFTTTSHPDEYNEFISFLQSDKEFKHKIVIAGNHDLFFDPPFYESSLKNLYHNGFDYDRKLAEEYKEKLKQYCIYLENSGCEIFGIKFFGAPAMPQDYLCPFSRDRGSKILMEWKKIPDDIDVLITHTPPKGILDLTLREKHAGCLDLREEVENRIKPKIHAFGHIHESYGIYFQKDIIYVNAAICNRNYKPTNMPVVLTWKKNKD